MNGIKVSLIILVHNAPFYTFITLKTLRKTKNINYETIIVDNKSSCFTKFILFLFHSLKKVNRGLYLDENTLFSKGNNIGSRLVSSNSTHILLLNSDIKINSPYWLEELLRVHEPGATSFGIARGDELPPRADGFCFIIDKDLYLRYQLDEFYEHWWGLTKLQADLLKAGYKVKAIRNYSEFITHFGQKSGKVKLKTNIASLEKVRNWFKDISTEIIDHL